MSGLKVSRHLSLSLINSAKNINPRKSNTQLVKEDIQNILQSEPIFEINDKQLLST